MHARTISLLSSLAALLATAPGGAETPSVGVSAVRARMFHDEDLVFFTPHSFDYFGSALASGDFNGDGAADLATGIPYHDGLTGSGCTNCGGVVVRYGMAGSGLETGLADDFLSEQYPGSFDSAQPDELFGLALAAGDFNGDGIDDLAVGIPMDYRYIPEFGVQSHLGAVQVHYGGVAGIQLVGGHFLQPGSNGVPDPYPEASATFVGGPEFGWALAAGDFDGDGADDLAIGIPKQYSPFDCSWGTCISIGGGVLVARGGIGGLLPFNGFYMFQGDQGLPDTLESGERFGQSVAAGDFNGDGYDDLAIGVPHEDGVGAALIVFGSKFSLIFTDHRYWGEYDLGGAGELEDAFASTLVTGDFDGDGRDDLAISAPYEDVFSAINGNVVDAGAATVLFGGASGFDLGRTQHLDQRFDAAVDVTSATWDLFGWSMAAGDFDGDGRDDLAIGHYGEDGASGLDSGAFTVVMGSAPGLDLGRHWQISQGLDGYPGGPAEDYRYLGYALAAGDFDGDGACDLAAGAPGEDDGNLANAGVEMVLYGALFADGFEIGTGFWTLTVQ